MPPLGTFMPSTAIAKWKVYVIRLHRLPIVEVSFVVPVSSLACSLVGMQATSNARQSPPLSTSSLAYSCTGRTMYISINVIIMCNTTTIKNNSSIIHNNNNKSIK
jgi:hypothetical protein